MIQQQALFITEHFARTWQQQLSEAFNTIEGLCDYLQLSSDTLPISAAAAKNFPIRVPLSFAACIEKGNPHDPLLRQVLPVYDETLIVPGYTSDPVGDLPAAAQTGIIHKYHGRVLLINTGSCAVNCRYCFRRNFPYAELQLGKQQEQAAIAHISSDASITEVILSGGDPLLLNDLRLAKLIVQLNGIKQLKRIRIHTRLPIVLPARITGALIDTLRNSSKQIVVVVHCNHANEINSRVIAACQQLKNSGITLLNQSVLLKGVNDNADVLSCLSEQLFAIGIIPYYLHLLDKATGTAHFEVCEADALELVRQLQNRLPGYLVPRLVKEQAGAASKQAI
ncbi:MAG: EF-P beta-lysylation protein EpmB [Methylovulum sp.]|nr:EF-P beta-lysylation protein EpmB [Methylovulum sp.]